MKIKGKQIVDGSVTSAKVNSSGTVSTVNAGDAAVSGSGLGIAKIDHQHAVATAQPVSVSDSTNSEGTSSSLARADHLHAHGDRAGGTLHALATLASPGFMSTSDKAKLDSLIDPNLVSAKDPVRVISMANISISGLLTIDGVALSSGDRVAVMGQSTVGDDGIYVVASGAWSRSSDFAVGSAQSGAIFTVTEGTAKGDTLWQISNDSGSDVVGTNDFVPIQIGAGSPRSAGAGLQLVGNEISVKPNQDGSVVASLANGLSVGVISDAQHGTRGGGTQHANVTSGGPSGFMSGSDKSKLDGVGVGAEANKTPRQESIVGQTITGANSVFTASLTNVPASNESVRLFVNGLLQEQGPGKDYTISGAAITWLASTGTAVDLDPTDDIVVTYES